MNITKDQTVAEIVSKNIKAAHVFKKYDIDFCCGGNKAVEIACKEKQIDFKTLTEELRHFDMELEEDSNYNNWPIDVLAEYIVAEHHSYVKENIPLLLGYAARVAKVHGNDYPEVVKIEVLFREVAKELSMHMEKEELILFPHVKQLVRAKREQKSHWQSGFGTVNNPISVMEKEHEDAGNIFKEIAELSANYTPPKEACNTFRTLYDKLEEFEENLHIHIHLENNILHPKALSLEESLKNGVNLN